MWVNIIYSLITLNQLLVMAALSLASKVQEDLTKLSDIVNTCYRSEGNNSHSL